MGQAAAMTKDLTSSMVERRVSVRHPVNLETSPHLIAALGNDFYLAKVRNISPEGISLVVNRWFEAGTVLNVDLIDRRSNRFSNTLQVRVLYAIEHPSGDWILGGLFHSKLAPEDMEIFLAKPMM